ncbi:MAG: DUF1624 domain-containing protein [Clostridiales bacterium]|jgi:uncharacterized membrane protein|nr:DUF1624 domain-containing protein [Clostridiales bacterium]
MAKTARVKKKRAWELDALRGLAILLVVWDHTMMDAAAIFRYVWLQSDNARLIAFSDFASKYYLSDLRFYGWPIFVFLFFFISGVCTSFSRNNFKRAFKLSIVALMLTLFTYIIDITMLKDSGYSVFIQFGVLHCFALCLWIYAAMEALLGLLSPHKKMLKKVESTVLLDFSKDEKDTPEYEEAYDEVYQEAINDTVYKKDVRNFKILTVTVLSIVFILSIVLNELYNLPLKNVMLGIGHPSDPPTPITGMFVFTLEWWTADYFPLLPYFIPFIAGAIIGVLFYSNKKSLLPMLDGKWHYFLTFPGRYSIFFYLGSQLLAFGIFYLISIPYLENFF